MGKQNNSWNIWVDTGGTFTDCLGIDPEGKWNRTKVLSSSALRGTVKKVLSDDKIIIEKEWDAPDHFIDGFKFILLGFDSFDSPIRVHHFNADESLITLDKSVIDPSWEDRSFEVVSKEEAPILAARLLTETSAQNALSPMNLRLATTRGTNALLERKGAPVTLFITKGFGDLLRIGTQQRPDLFSLRIEKSAPLYQKVIEVDERIDANGEILRPLNLNSVSNKAKKMIEEGVGSAAVVCMNSYLNPKHEQRISNLLKEVGFKYVSTSSDLSRFVKILSRAETTLVNACLAPIMKNYLQSVTDSMREGQLSIMTSAGGLMNSSKFTPKDGLLSGPAAGVVGAATIGKQAGFNKIISFDMGGTSTDVSRYDEDYEYIFEHNVGDAHLMAPAVAVETVAAGGGSVCSFDGHTLRVGPESAGASPGPACYGADGPLTLTDVNLLAGRLDEENFHIPIDIEAAEQKLKYLAEAISKKQGDEVTSQTLLEGLIEIANQKMAKAIEKISLRKGYDPKEYGLVSFGGAGGQHCCAIAKQIGIDKIIIPKDAGLLSAYGLGHAVMEHFEEKQILENLHDISSAIPEMIKKLTRKAMDVLSREVDSPDLIVRRQLLFIRLKGQESTLEIAYQPNLNVSEVFREAYEKRYGHTIDDTPIEIESIRVVVSTKPKVSDNVQIPVQKKSEWKVLKEKEILFDEKKVATPVYHHADAVPGTTIKGPALILDPYSTLLVEPGWSVHVDDNSSLILHYKESSQQNATKGRPEAVEQELFTHRFTSIAEKMGEMLKRTALSINIKERQDFSCALLNPEGELVVNAPHIPVHLGALGMCVRKLKESIDMQPGDMIITNHPAFGGSHLPDVTVVTPVFTAEEQLIGYVANRAHHAEIGGSRPGSMPPDATSLVEEGVVIPPMYLVQKGNAKLHEIRDHLLSAAYPARNIEENMADLQAQMAANRRGAEALQSLAARYGLSDVHHYMDMIKGQARKLMQETIKQIPNGTYEATEYLDDGTPLSATWTIQDESVNIDFSGTGPVHPYNLNANPAIARSVVIYVLRVLVGQPIPLNEGLMDVVSINLPECLLNPDFSDKPEECPAVVGGNVEISQRLTDTLLKPFKRIACGQGTMNNILFGNNSFGYYETVGGGSGAGPGFNGTDGVHQHMTNTRGTDPEIFEQRYPVRLDKYAIRKNSGGKGEYKGGDGIIRKMTFLESAELSVLTQHRIEAPYGQAGGESGKTGSQWVMRKSGEKIVLESADSFDMEPGDRFILQTPGGGGFGHKDSNNK